MKRNIFKAMALCALTACLSFVFTACEEEQTPQEEAVKTLDGTWTLSQATAAYQLGPKAEKVKTPLNNKVLNSIFGSTSFTFNTDGSLYVGDNKTCRYEVNEDATILTMYIHECTFTCDIVSLTTNRVELGLSGREVVNNIITYLLGISLGDIPLDATCSLVFTR